MNLNIFYRSNPTSDKLLQYCKKYWSEVTTREIVINDLEYTRLSVKDNLTPKFKTINTPRAIENSLNLNTIEELLRTNNISLYKGKEKIIRTYDILLYDMGVISVKLTVHGKNKEQTKFVKEKNYAKVVETAQRVMHFIGLDLGRIQIFLTARRSYKVSAIDPSPDDMEKSELDQLMNKIYQTYYINRDMSKNEVKLGADPEFMMINKKSGKIVYASEFFPKDGIVGCDNIRVPNRYQRPVAEIRPRPDISPLKLIENIRNSLKIANKMAPYRNVKWIAGSLPAGNYSIGGHIHFSNIPITGGLLRALDNYIGLPVFMIEKPDTAVKRRKKYGFLGDYRVKDHGGFEYRTPGSWLVSQQIATAVLCLAKIVVSRYYYLSRNYLNTVEAQSAFYTGKREYFSNIFLEIWEQIQQLDLYDDYADHLAILPEMINENASWDEQNDFRKAWNISVSRKNYSTPRSTNIQQYEANSTIRTQRTGNNTVRSSSQPVSRGVPIGTVNSSNNTLRTNSRNTVGRNRFSQSQQDTRIISAHQVRRNTVIR